MKPGAAWRNWLGGVWLHGFHVGVAAEKSPIRLNIDDVKAAQAIAVEEILAAGASSRATAEKELAETFEWALRRIGNDESYADVSHPEIIARRLAKQWVEEG